MDFITDQSPTQGLEEEAPAAPYVPTSPIESAAAGAFKDLNYVNDYLNKVRAGQGGIRYGSYVPPEPRVDAKTLQAKFPGVAGLDEPMPVSVAQDMADAQRREAVQKSAAARYPSGVVPAVEGLAAGAIAGMLDPVDQAAFMVPVVGEARYATWLARAGEEAGVFGRAGVTVGVGAIRGAAGGAVVSGGEYAAGVDPDMTLGDVASQTLQMAAGGALFHGLASIKGDILGRRFVDEAAYDADLHDARTRAAAAQMAEWLPVEVRPMTLGHGEKPLRSSLMGSAAPVSEQPGIPADRGPASPLQAEGGKPIAIDKETGKPIYRSGLTPTETPKDLLDNAVARANGAPSQDDVRLQHEAEEARATTPEAVTAGQMEEERAAIEKMRAAGDLDAEDEAALKAADEQNVSRTQTPEEGRPAPERARKTQTEEGVATPAARAPEEGAGGGKAEPHEFSLTEPDEAVFAAQRKEFLDREYEHALQDEPDLTREEFDQRLREDEEHRRQWEEHGQQVAREAQEKDRARVEARVREAAAAAQREPPAGEPPRQAAHGFARERLKSGYAIEGRNGERISLVGDAVGSGEYRVQTTTDESNTWSEPFPRNQAVNHAIKLAGGDVEEPAPRAQIQPEETAQDESQRTPGTIRGEGAEAPGNLPHEADRGGEEGRNLQQPGEQPVDVDRGLDQQPGARPGETRPPVAGGEGESREHTPDDFREQRDAGIVAPGRGDGERDRPERRVRGQNYRIDAKDLADRIEHFQKNKQAGATANVFAVQILKEIPDGAPATAEQQDIMARYMGWGGLPQVFDESNAKFESSRSMLKEMLTTEQYEAARASTINAHYTSLDIAGAMWDALRSFGFEGDGTVLEPGMGIGNFMGMRPEGVEPRFTGVELDGITGQLARKLYPEAKIHVAGFQDVKLPSNVFDAVIGNVPFADARPFDPIDNPERALSLHNYFIAKSLRTLKPGGVMSVISTHYTLDAASSGARKAFHDAGGDLIGAIRLPDTAFKGNAGTEVVADILFFRKRGAGEQPRDDAWLRSDMHEIGDGKERYNAYFEQHPEDVLGEHSLKGTMYKAESYTVKGPAEGLGNRIRERAAAIADRADARFDAEEGTMPEHVEELPENAKIGAFFEQGGKVFQNTMAGAAEAELPKNAVPMVKSMIRMRDLARTVLDEQKKPWDGEGTPPWADAQAQLNKEYDAFIDKHGPINKVQITERTMPDGEKRQYRRYPNLKHFRDDPDAFLVAALENFDEESGKASKAAIMSERVIDTEREITHANTPEEALIASMNRKGGVDMPYMTKLMGKSESDISKGLTGRIFRDPTSGNWQLSEQYLAGNVRAKLAAVRAAAEVDHSLEPNVRALEAVQPKDLESHEIDVRLGAPWVPKGDVEDFIHELIDTTATVRHVASEAAWRVDLGRSTVKNEEEWGVPGATADRMISDALNQRSTQVMYYDPEGKPRVHVEKTIVAQEKQQQIKDRFGEWLWEDGERAARLSRFYNDNYNNLVDSRFDGEHLTLPGSSAAVNLRPTQKAAIWRYLVTGNTLLDHVVGSGKTYTAIGAGMEAKRIGLVKKPGYAVPNHMLEQFSREFLQLYPSARILVAAKEEMSRAVRRAFINKAATGNWDAVVFTHAGFEKIPLSPERQAEFIRDEIGKYEDAIREAGGRNGDRITVKMLEGAKNRRAEKLKELMAGKERYKGLSFEDTGIDGLFVDEAHYFKNLEFATKMRNIAAKSSQRAFDLFVKSRYVNDLSPGRGLMFMTGTPISNSMSEMFTMQRYLAPQALAERNLSHFDAWAAQFGDTVTKPEIAPDGLTARLKTRFAKFRNIPELVGMYRQFADLVDADKLEKSADIELPKIESGKSRTIVAPSSPALLDYVHELADRAQAIKDRKVTPEEDNMLKISNDGRNAALDMRLVHPGSLAEPDRKAVHVAKNVYDIWKETADRRGTQLVFLDRSTPKGDGSFNVYDDLRNMLIEHGIPRKEIAFIHDADTDEKKALLFKDVRGGRVRVLVGSTDKMGVGTNVQDKLVALHNFDTPWRPADLEQRIGRIVRQGNPNKTVKVHNYVTEGSFDAYMWQTLERKARFINQVKNGDPNVRTAEDIDDNALSYAEVKAIASGNPLVMRKAQIDNDVDRLGRLRSAHRGQQARLKQTVAAAPERLKNFDRRQAAAIADAAKLNLGKGDQFEATIGNKRLLKRADAAEALGQMITSESKRSIEEKRGLLREVRGGNVGGFDFGIMTDGQGNAYLNVKHADGEAKIPVNAAAPTGALTRLENHLGDVAKEPDRLAKERARFEKETNDAQALIGKPFDREEDYQAALKEQSDVDQQLGITDAEGNATRAQAARAPFGRRGLKEAPTGTRPLRLDDGTVLHLPERPTPEEQRVIDGVNAIAHSLAPKARTYAARDIEMEGRGRRSSGTTKEATIQGLTQIDPDTGRNLIAWSLSAESPKVTVRHEVIHWLRANGFFTGDEWKAIEREAAKGGWAEKFQIDQRYPHAPDWLKTEEAAAEAFGHAGDMPSWIPESLHPIFDRFRTLLARVADFVKRAFGAQATAKDVFSRIESGEIGGRRMGSGETGPATTAAQTGRLETEKDRQNAARRQLTTYQDIRKRGDNLAKVADFRRQGLPLSKSIDALTRGINEPVKGARESTAQQQIARQADLVGRFMGNLDKIPGAMKAWRDRTHTAEWTRELFELNLTNGGKPGVTGSKLGLAIARAVHDAEDTARFHLNRSGAWIGDYEGYIAKTLHNAVAIDRAGLDAWRDFTMERLDQSRTFDDIENDEDLNEANKAARVEQFMKNGWDALSTGVHISSAGGAASKAGAFPPGFNLARQRSSERIFHWKGADAWRQYQERFGDPVIERGVLNSLMRAGRDTALMERWGSNPQNGFEHLLRKMKETYRGDHAAIAELNRQERRLREEFAYLTGEAMRPQNDLKTKISGAVRGWQDITKLSYVLFTHMSVGATKPFQLRYHGMGRWQAYTSVLRNLLQDKSDEGRATLENLRANATGQVQNIISGYEPIDGVPGQVAKLRMIAMRMGGLPWMLSREKSGSQWELANFLGQKVGQEFEHLKPQTQRALTIYGIGKPEWDALRTAPFHDKDGQGSSYLTPAAARRASDDAIAPLAGERYDNARRPEDRARILDETRDRLAMKLAAYYSDSGDRSVVTPGIPERAFFTQHAGRFAGPMVGQYKTWALAAVRQMWGQAVYGSSKAEAVKMLAELVAVGTALGYARNAIRDTLTGKEPELFSGEWKHDLPLIGRSMLAGGGLGIFGDYLLGQFSNYSQSGKDRALEFLAKLAGPVAGDIGSVYGMGSDLVAAPFSQKPGRAFRDTGAEGLRFFLDHVPIINAFYIRTIANWMILDRLQDMASPGYLKRYQDSVKKHTGQKMWLPPTQYLGGPQAGAQ